jgi:hypothetical protein
MSGTSRRTFGKLMLALPAATLAATAGAEEKAAEPPEVARALAGLEPGLSDEERTRLAKALGDSLKPLQTVRDFKLPADADPAFRFRALPSKRS